MLIAKHITIFAVVIAMCLVTVIVSATPSEPTIDATVNPKFLVDETEVTTEDELTTEPIIATQNEWENIGTFKLTAYCPCPECSDEWGDMTSTGVKATENRTIAVDPKVIPYGSEVKINGTTYIAEDCGGAIKQNKIDIYFGDHEEANAFGVQYAEVELFTGGA